MKITFKDAFISDGQMKRLLDFCKTIDLITNGKVRSAEVNASRDSKTEYVRFDFFGSTYPCVIYANEDGVDGAFLKADLITEKKYE